MQGLATSASSTAGSATPATTRARSCPRCEPRWTARAAARRSSLAPSATSWTSTRPSRRAPTSSPSRRRSSSRCASTPRPTRSWRSSATTSPRGCRDAAHLSTIGVWGAWHLGSVVAAGLAALGHDVWVTDLSEAAVAQLTSGVAPVREPGLDDLIAGQLAAGSLHPVPATDPRLGDLEYSVIAADVEVRDDDTASLGTLQALVQHMGSVLHARTV